MYENNEKNNQGGSEEERADTQAFKWEYEKTPAEETTDQKAPDQDAPDQDASDKAISDSEGSDGRGSVNEENGDVEVVGGDTVGGETVGNETIIEAIEPLSKDAQQNAENREKREKRRYSTKALIKESTVATLLSAFSVILLVTLTILLTLGIIPTDKRVVFVQVSNLGPVGTAVGDASAEVIEDFKNSVVIITVKTATGSAMGSGIIITEDGYIATNCHVVSDADDIKITLYNSDKTVPARLVGYSERDDIAVVKANLEGLRPATFANSEDCRVGDRVYAVGAPESTEFGWTVTQGIISSNLREIKIYGDDYILEKKMYLLQTDAAVNPGNSGGPLINARGEVVGIVTLKRTDSAGMGFALPSSASLELIEAIIKTGSVDGVTSKLSSGRPLIGIVGVGLEADVWYEETDSGVREVDKAYALAHPDTCIITDVAGVYVTSLNPGLDAANHLLPGDVIVSVNGTAVYITYDIMNVINQFNGGDTVTVEYVRDGKNFTAEITLGVEE